MSSFAASGFVVFTLILFIGIYLSLFGLPGTVIIFLDVLLYAVFTGFEQVGWKVLLFLLVFSAFAEAIDFWAGYRHGHETPVTGRSLRGAVIGGTAGMIILTPFLWGLGIWGGFFLGGLAGLLITELRRQSSLRIPHQASSRDFLAMIFRKTVKGLLALVMIFVSLSHIYS
ncbi:MAG: DUF456 domain-containing protein [Smithellaceae bacterium]